MLTLDEYEYSSTAQASTAPAAKPVRADQSVTTQASRQSWREQVSRRAFIQLAVLSKRTKKSKSARSTKNIYNHSRSSLAGVMREGKCLYFPCHSISYMHAASGMFSWTMELLAFVSRQFAPKIAGLPVRPTRISFNSSL